MFERHLVDIDLYHSVLNGIFLLLSVFIGLVNVQALLLIDDDGSTGTDGSF